MRLCARIFILALTTLTALYPPAPERGITMARSDIPGIVDLYYEGELVNNLVVVVPFEGGYNNSELQGSEVAISEHSIDYSPFDREEALNPASHAEIHLHYVMDGDRLRIWSNRPIGLGLFFGLYHGVDHITLDCGEELCPECDEITPYYELGHFEQYSTCGFTLHSAYDLPDVHVRSRDGSRVDVETRTCPWCPQHAALHERLRRMTGSLAWFEAGIAFGSSFEVTFLPHDDSPPGYRR